MKTLYLHIGTHKTGTTAIQQFCDYNAKVLNQKGIFYPQSLIAKRNGHSSHFFFAKAFFDICPEYGKVTFSHTKKYDKWIKLFENELAKSHPDNDILISTELFILHTFPSSTLKKLREILLKYADKIKVIVYFRRQDTLFQSWWAERAKWDTLIPPCDFNAAKDIFPVLREGYDACCDAWRDVFGKENLIVRTYERHLFPNKDVVEDFLSIFNLKKSDGFKNYSAVSNPSMPRDFLMFRLMLNPLLKQVGFCERYLFSEKMYLHIKSKEKGDSNLISPQACAEILKYYQRGNEYVAHEYMKREDKTLFYEKQPDTTLQWHPPEHLPDSKILTVFQTISDHMPYRSVWLIGLVIRGLNSSDTQIKNAAECVKVILRCQRCPRLLFPLQYLPLKLLGIFKIPGLRQCLRWLVSKDLNAISKENEI